MPLPFRPQFRSFRNIALHFRKLTQIVPSADHIEQICGDPYISRTSISPHTSLSPPISIKHIEKRTTYHS